MKFVQVFLAVFLTQSSCLGQSAQGIARTAFNSVVLLEMTDSNGQPLSLGSGFFVSNNVIATNAHVIEGAFGGTARLVENSHAMQILGTVAIDRHADLALLKVDKSAPALNLNQNPNLNVGDKVYVVGNPLGLEGTFSEGIISAIRHLDADSMLQMTAPISPGSSGGPVMDAVGNVIGIAEATFRDGQNLNLAVPVSYLLNLWASTSANLAVTPLAQQQSIASSHSVVDRIGTRIESGVTATNFALKYSKVGYGGDKAGFELRINNKLPVAISEVRLRMIYRDASSIIMDFEDFTYQQSIPPGLTKTITVDQSEVALRAAQYYDVRSVAGAPLPPPTGDNFYNYNVKRMQPNVEIRIVGFGTEKPE
ncbi:MAG TPA: S1C family serine protease [Terracidiphilus sp.]